MTRPPKIFLNYRRQDSSGHAGRLYDDLVKRFGSENVFMDIDKLQPGLPFDEAIELALEECDVVVCLIGRQWLSVTDSRGRRRLDNPDDFVRLEIEAALTRNDVRVIPARIQGAEMPSRDDVPDGLVPLVRRHGVELSDTRWHYDVGRLIEVLEEGARARAAREAARTEVTEERKREAVEPTAQAVTQSRDRAARTWVEEVYPPRHENARQRSVRQTASPKQTQMGTDSSNRAGFGGWLFGSENPFTVMKEEWVGLVIWVGILAAIGIVVYLFVGG